jgi:hypothetical protein
VTQLPEPFTCPFCSAIGHNPSDADRRYCGQCRVVVDDAITRRDELGACRGHATMSVCTTEGLEQCEACGLEVRIDQVRHRFFGFGAGCIWREFVAAG